MADKIVAFKAYVMDLKDGIYKVKIKSDAKSVLYISEDDVVNSGIITVDVATKKKMQCRESGIFKIETEKTSFRPERIEKYFTVIGEMKVANMSFKTFLDEKGKPGSGTSPQAIDMGLRNEFV